MTGPHAALTPLISNPLSTKPTGIYHRVLRKFFSAGTGLICAGAEFVFVVIRPYLQYRGCYFPYRYHWSQWVARLWNGLLQPLLHLLHQAARNLILWGRAKKSDFVTHAVHPIHHGVGFVLSSKQ